MGAGTAEFFEQSVPIAMPPRAYSAFDAAL
jgi:hypothetical protein